MGLKTENKIKMEGGMSSMTDLVFLLLIFLIVISTLISSGVNIDLPQSSSSESKDQPVEVNITENNVYTLDNDFKTESLNDLEQKIRTSINPEKPVITLTGHPKSNWEMTVHVIDIAKKNNIEIALKD